MGHKLFRAFESLHIGNPLHTTERDFRQAIAAAGGAAPASMEETLLGLLARGGLAITLLALQRRDEAVAELRKLRDGVANLLVRLQGSNPSA